MKEIIKDLKGRLVEYNNLVQQSESIGLDNLNYEETESYGVYVGKVEILEELIPKLEKI